MHNLALREYQKDAIDSINKAFVKGINKQVAVLATGLGKTIIFSHLISERVQKLGKKALILAHREELLIQAKEKLIRINPELKIGIEQAESTADDVNDDIVIASVATIGKENSKRLAAFNPKEYMTVIVDEAHHASAETYKNVFKHFGILKNTEYDWNKDVLFLGVTATPNRNDNHGIDEIFDEVIYQYDIIDGIKNNWLSRIRAIRIDTQTDISNVKDAAGDFSIHELAKKINTEKRNKLIVKTYQDLALGKQALIFAADVEHTQALYEEFTRVDIPSALITGTTDKKTREEQLKKFANKETQVMINAMVLTEGYDNAGIDYIFMARPTQSGILYHQMIGRGTRIHKDKEYLMIVDFVDNTMFHSLQTSASLLGFKDAINFQGEDIIALKEDLDRLREKRPYYNFDRVDIKKIKYTIQEIDILQQEREKKLESNFEWHTFGVTFRIGIGNNRFFIIKQSLTGQYQLSKYTTNFNTTTSFIGSFENRIEAVKHAEYPLGKGFGSTMNPLFSTDEPWKNDIPTEAQIQALRTYGIPESTLLMLTKGEASKMISKLRILKSK